MDNTIFENPNLTISLEHTPPHLSLKWKGFIKEDSFRRAASEILSAINAYRVSAVLSDNTEWKVISPNDHGWAAGQWFPAAEKLGIRHMAIVESADYFNRASGKAIIAMADIDHLIIRHFTDQSKAIQWLQKAYMENAAV